MDNAWSEYLKNNINQGDNAIKFAFEDWLYNNPLRYRIERLFPAPSKILEVGAGTCVFSVLLDKLGYDVTCSDVNKEVLEIAKNMIRVFD